MENNYILPFLWMKGESQEIIREEIEKIDQCGIKAICLESRPHPDFMGEKWWEDVTFIIGEAKKRGMKIWILDDAHFPTGYANGLVKSKYPERKKHYLRYNVVNVWGKQGEISVNVKQMTKPLISFLELDKPMDMEERGKNKLVAVVAYPLREDHKLDESGVIDLTEHVRGDYLSYRFPKDNYRIFVVYDTCTDGGSVDYINMMDKESVSTLIEAVYEPHYAHFPEEFGKTIAGFFSDEPEIGNMGGFSSDTQIGNSKMPLPWSEEVKERFRKRYGGDWKAKLPYLWTESLQMQECPQVRHDFMDIVTTLYQENFSCQLGEWCGNHQVEYIGHVVEDDNLHQRLGNGTGHYFRAMTGQHMAGIDVIADQVTVGDKGYTRSGIFERSGAFFQYALGKMGASAGHLDPKKQGRTMCELFGASGWQTGTRDMKFILDHLLVRGINYLVPHAFSMAEYPDADCPPHFYARGKNPQFKYFVKLMKYANRMCDLLAQGRHEASVAVLYPAEAEWGGNAMLVQEPARELLQHQIEFDFVSADMLADPKAYGGRDEADLLCLNGQEFSYLVIPAAQGLPEKVFDFIRKHPGIKVIFIDQKPVRVLGTAVPEKELKAALTHGAVVPLAKLGGYLKQQEAEAVRLAQDFSDLVYYHYKKDCDLYVFHNESAFDTFRGVITLPLTEGAVYYDGMEDAYYALPVQQKDGKSLVEIELPPYGMGVILAQETWGEQQVLKPYRMLSEKLKACTKRQRLDGSWSYAIATEQKFPWFMEPEVMERLQPVSNIMPEFSGHIAYEKEFEIEQTGEKAYLEFTEVHEAIELYVNGKRIGEALCPPYVFEISEALKEGKNQLRAVVTTTLDRDQVNYPEPFIILDHHVSESAGLDGEVVLYQEYMV